VNKSILQKLLSPLSLDDFFENYWENKFIHLPHKAGYFNDVLAVTDIDQYLSRQDLMPEAIKLVENGDRIPELKWTDKITLIDGSTAAVANNEKMFKLYNAGATIVINSAQAAIPPLANVCRLVAQELKINLQANIYITPANSQGFGMHYDPHDIFLLQIKGPKRWKIYDSGEELPTTYSSFKKTPALISEFEINSGDFLYMPRGTVHEAFSSEVATVHVNFSCKPSYGYHLLNELALYAEKEDVFFRKTIPNGFKNETDTLAYANLFKQKLDELLNKVNPMQLLASLNERFAANQLLDLSGRLVNIFDAERLNLETTLVRKKGLDYLVKNTPNGLEIHFGKQKLNVPMVIDPVLFLQDEPFKVKQIKGLLTNKGRLEIAGDFVKAGFLIIRSID
jgi:ribosomal protein L16 Arg81 hydroxylase